MKKVFAPSLFALLLTVWLGPCAQANTSLTSLVKEIQPAVATVITYDSNRKIAGIGSGFFIDNQGHFITNHHVVKQAYDAEIKTAEGRKYPIRSVTAVVEDADLVKVTVDIPPGAYRWLAVEKSLPSIAERIFVVGSPLGLEQTVSEGIVSAVREMPVIGSFFQMSAPISVGSSGSPVINMRGRVVGVVTFMIVMGQNLNFAVPAAKIRDLQPLSPPVSLAQWTYGRSRQNPQMAERLCREGFEFIIDGKYKDALNYYREAAEKDPENLMAWYGLSHCYVGLDQPQKAIEIFKQAIRINPDDALLRYNLGNYYNKIGQPEDAVEAYQESIRLNPESALAYDKLGITLGLLGHYEEALRAHREVARLLPDYAAAYYNIGVTSGLLGRYRQAIDAYRIALRLDPELSGAHTNLGRMYLRIDDADSAAASFKEAIRINPDETVAHHQLALIYLKKQSRADALQEYKILLRLDPHEARTLFEKIYPSGVSGSPSN